MLEPPGSSPPLAILTDFRRFIVVALHRHGDQVKSLVSPSIPQYQLSPSLISLAVYAFIRSPSRPLPLSEDSRAKVEAVTGQKASEDFDGDGGGSDVVFLEQDRAGERSEPLACATHSAFEAGGGLASIEELKTVSRVSIVTISKR